MRLEIESTVSSPIAVDNGSINNADISNLLKQGVAAAQNGDRPMARTLLSSVTDADPNCVDAWLWLASISEYPEELLVFLKKVLDIEPDNERALTWEAATRSLLAKTHVQRGIIAAEEGNHDFAKHCFDDAIANDELCEAAWYWKASLSEDENEKMDLLMRVLEIDPEHADAKDAVNVIEQAWASAKMHDAKRAAAEGNFDTACGLLDEIHASDPENCEAWVLRVHVVRSFEEKFDAYDRILQLDPSNAFAQYGYEFLDELAESVKPAELVESFEQMVQTEHETPDPIPDADLLNSGSELDPAEAETRSEFELAESVDAEQSDDESEPNPAWADQNDQDLEFSVHVDRDVVEEPWTQANDEQTASVDDAPVESNVTDENFDGAYVPAEQPDVEVSYESETETISFDYAENDDPIAGFPEWDEPVSMVAEEAAQEAESYASPTAETMEFRAEDHDLDEVVAVVDTAAVEIESEFSSESYDGEVVAIPSPWDAPAQSEGSVAEFAATETQQPILEPEVPSEQLACPYCSASIERQAFSCTNCNAVLTLSDIESLLSNGSVDFGAVRQSVSRMEADHNSRACSVEELKALGIGQFNLKNFELGFAYIQEASRLEPNDVILAGQLNALAIRLDEIKRQDEINEAKPKGKTILVVDDSPTVRKLISSKLEKSGHQVICAVDGVEAMTMIETMVPDLVLLDIAMPRMDGYQVCKLIRANDAAKDVPVVMISGKDGFFDKVRGRMAGTTGYITKPFGPETLMKALETYLIPETAVAE